MRMCPNFNMPTRSGTGPDVPRNVLRVVGKSRGEQREESGGRTLGEVINLAIVGAKSELTHY